MHNYKKISEGCLQQHAFASFGERWFNSIGSEAGFRCNITLQVASVFGLLESALNPGYLANGPIILFRPRIPF